MLCSFALQSTVRQNLSLFHPFSQPCPKKVDLDNSFLTLSHLNTDLHGGVLMRQVTTAKLPDQPGNENVEKLHNCISSSAALTFNLPPLVMSRFF